MQVARLAGMPASVLRQARTSLEALEAQKAGTQDQVDLFAAPPAPTALEDSPALRALRELDLDSCSPREALEQLYRIKQLAR